MAELTNIIELTAETIQDQLIEMNGNYPNPLPSELLLIRADTWLRELNIEFHRVDEKFFIEACGYHLRNNRFYPVLQDIVDGYRYAVEHRPKPLALSEPRIVLTEEELAERKELFRKLREKCKLKTAMS